MGLSGCRNSSPPAATPLGYWSRRSGLYFCSPFPPSHSLRIHPAGGDLGGQRIRPEISAGSRGPSGQGKTGHAPFCSSALLMVPQFTPLGMGSLPLPQPPLRSASPLRPPLLLPLHSPHTPRLTQSLGVPPVPLGVRGPPPVPGRCPSCEET